MVAAGVFVGAGLIISIWIDIGMSVSPSRFWGRRLATSTD